MKGARHAYLLSQDDNPCAAINCLYKHKTATLFILKMSEETFQNAISCFLQSLTNNAKINRLEMYLLNEEEYNEFGNALSEFYVEVEYRNHIRINGTLHNLLLIAKTLPGEGTGTKND